MIRKFAVLAASLCLLTGVTSLTKEEKAYRKLQGNARKARGRECKALRKKGIDCNDPVQTGTAAWVNPYPNTEAGTTTTSTTTSTTTTPTTTTSTTTTASTTVATTEATTTTASTASTAAPTEATTTKKYPEFQICEPSTTLAPIPDLDLSACDGLTGKSYARCKKGKQKTHSALKKQRARLLKDKAKALNGWRKWNKNLKSKKRYGSKDSCKYLADSEVSFTPDGPIEKFEVDGGEVDMREGIWTINRPSDVPYADGWYILAVAPDENKFIEVHVEDNSIESNYLFTNIQSMFPYEQKNILITGFEGWCDCETTKTFRGDIMTPSTDASPETYHYYYCYGNDMQEKMDNCYEN